MVQKNTLVPKNTNTLTTTNYSFVIPEMPHLNYWCQSVLLPSVATNEVLVPTPLSETYRHGDKLIYEPLVITFLVDEDLRNWEETYDWLQGLTYPRTREEYIKNRTKSPYKDGILDIYTNANNTNLRIKFTECHPTVLGSIQFDSTADANMVLVSDLTIRYDTFSIERI